MRDLFKWIKQKLTGQSEDGPDDDTRSMAASSVMSLYHRVHFDPLEKDWLRSSAVGNITAQRLLLTQDPALAHKKTALHWAAKQGRLDTVDLMFLSSVDVNVRSGYTALHLASIHGHQHMVLALINTYNAKTDIRDYHGKMAVHYWSGNTDVFNKPGSQSGGKLSYGRRSQRYALPSMLLSRSRSQGQLSLDFTTGPQSPRLHILDLPMGF
ncbi:Ankyrin repeat domain-containing protein SOWAHC [Merluccius polli]|uniref:Ankyrin repeat domain-containing protein SOWAHC n=1 Tax=Merluccius polli TaxID=89951 RepID=A0AA47MPB6_MERPO|nr:Ankyrin repeat domain-containing protein SOWAHC [Merluccius polli]